VNDSQQLKSDTNFLRFIAILFIINSHLDAYYPVSYFATGGALGNALFFTLSAFGLLLSETNNPRNFTNWYARRITRIYPSVWVVLIILTIPYKISIGSFDINDILTFMGNLFYPPFWFLQAIMIFYFIIFFIIKKYNVRKVYYFLSALAVFYVVIYLSYLDLSVWCIEDPPFKFIFYLMIFIFGVFLADKNKTITYSGIQDWLILFSLIIIMYGHKYLMMKHVLTSIQFIQQLILFPVIYFFFKISRSNLIQKKIMCAPVTSSIINFFSDRTLEIYIVSVYISLMVIKLNIPFPINIVVFLIITFMLATLTKYVSKFIVSLFRT